MNKNEAPEPPDANHRCCGRSSAISKEGYEQRLMLSSRGQLVFQTDRNTFFANRYSYPVIAGSPCCSAPHPRCEDACNQCAFNHSSLEALPGADARSFSTARVDLVNEAPQDDQDEAGV